MYIYNIIIKQIITQKTNTMRKLNKLSTFEKVQLTVMTVVMSTLAITVINWGVNGFISTF